MSASFVTIAGSTYKVFDGTAYEEPPDLLGDSQVLDSGEIQSSERTPKRKYAAVLKCDPPSAFDTLRDAISAVGASGVPTPVAVTSPSDGLTRGASLQAWCRLGRAQYRTKGNGANKTTTISVPIAIREA